MAHDLVPVLRGNPTTQETMLEVLKQIRVASATVTAVLNTLLQIGRQEELVQILRRVLHEGCHPLDQPTVRRRLSSSTSSLELRGFVQHGFTSTTSLTTNKPAMSNNTETPRCNSSIRNAWSPPPNSPRHHRSAWQTTSFLLSAPASSSARIQLLVVCSSSKLLRSCEKERYSGA